MYTFILIVLLYTVHEHMQAMHYRKYSVKSDVWSYGCVVYEIWSLGCKPFEDLPNVEVNYYLVDCHSRYSVCDPNRHLRKLLMVIGFHLLLVVPELSTG